MSKMSQEMVHELLASKSLDYTVESRMIPNPINGKDTPFYGTFRTDTEEFLQMGLSKRFTPIQNADAFAFLTELSGSREFEVPTGGSLNGGAQVYLQLSFGKTDVGGGDMVGNYLTVVNSHDGSRALNVILTPYRFFCKNQIAPAFRRVQSDEEAGRNVRMRLAHTIQAKAEMENILRTVAIADGQFTASVEHYRKMAQTKVTTEQARAIIEKAFPKPDATGRALSIWEGKIHSAGSRFVSAEHGRVEQFSAWNLYNAIQGTVQHDSRETQTKTSSILFGSIAERSGELLSMVSELAAVA